MYEKYHASFGAIVWCEIKWGFKLFRKAVPEIIAGIGFMVIMLSLPILAGFIIG